MHIVIVSGGNLGEWTKPYLSKADRLIGVDRGALYLVRGGYRPDEAVGDFDSVTPEEAEEIQSCSGHFISCDPVMKDLTDTEMAFERALAAGPDEIVLLGSLGTRFDHSLANVHLLYKGLENGVNCKIVDEHNEIRVTDRSLELGRGRFRYVSLLPLTVEASGICLEGFRYPLHNATLRMGHSRGISNVLEAETGRISVKSGVLLVMQSRD